jgi:hypothetical protein
MATTRLIALHQRKGKSIAHSLGERTDYAKNPEKTEKGELVTGYACDPMTADEEFLLQKRQYVHITGKNPKHDIIAYQIRQSFKPGEITAEEANRVGYELGIRFTKGNYSFIVATHTDRAHIHNHIIFNSTSMDGTRKFKNFWLSGRALQRLSDMVCLENGLSVIESLPYSERSKRTTFPERESFREKICRDIDTILAKKPKDFPAFLQMLEAAGYEIKQTKNIALRGKSQKRFIRLSSLGDGYTEADLRAVISGIRAHAPKSKYARTEQSVNVLLNVQQKLQEKGEGYAKWAKIYNLKQVSKSVLLFHERGAETTDQINALVDKTVKKRDALQAQMAESEKRLVEIATLKKHIVNYSKTRNTYEAYRKAGYSKKFFEEHREEITLHKAAKKAFDELGLASIPKVKELSTEYAEILASKKKTYAEFRKVRDEAQELLIARQNLVSFSEAEPQEPEKNKKAEKAR